MVLEFYSKVLDFLKTNNRLVLLVVIANDGSSPGRKGFKMLVTNDSMFGTVGGGIMEHKLVEYARSLLGKPTFSPFIKHQIHDKSALKDQSGMICSGQQSIAFFDINKDFIPILQEILTLDKNTISYSNYGINANIELEKAAWNFIETKSLVQKVYIIGGGHVGLALSEVLARLDFEIHVFDDRKNLNTMDANTFVHSQKTVAFEEIQNYIPEGNDSYVVIMSFGYRTDDIIMRKLINKNFKYIGLLGSKEKIKTLFQNMITDGFAKEQIAKVYAPIGIAVKSQTTQEIAISIAAELIRVKNENK